MKIMVLIAISVFLCSCATTGRTPQEIAKESALTPGMVGTYIKSGVTTQAEMMETFGPPNLVTHKKGCVVWTYDKISSESSAGGGFWSLLFAGSSSSHARRSSRSVMLVVYFDKDGVVKDYRLSATKF